MITTYRTQDLLGMNAAKLEKITPICAGTATMHLVIFCNYYYYYYYITRTLRPLYLRNHQLN